MNKDSKPTRFYSGGFLFNPQTREVLLHKRDGNTENNPYKWAFFGGLNEGVESAEEAFIREMKEELNIDIALDEVQKLCDYLNIERGTHRSIYFVESELDKSEMTLDEGEDFEWIALDKVFEYDLTEKTVLDLRTFLSENK